MVVLHSLQLHHSAPAMVNLSAGLLANGALMHVTCLHHDLEALTSSDHRGQVRQLRRKHSNSPCKIRHARLWQYCCPRLISAVLKQQLSELPRACCAGYAHMTQQLMQLPAAGLVLALEGGYNERVIAECSAACVQVHPPPFMPIQKQVCANSISY